MSSSLRWFAWIPLLLTGPALAQEVEPRDVETLWSIGTVDRDTRELALAPDGYDRWEGDALFVVGRSDPARDWPYVHPGPHDAWAGGGAHAFTVVFAFEGEVPATACELRIELVDTHGITPPRVGVRVNGVPVGERQMPAGAGDASVFGEPEKGRRDAWTVEVPPAVLRSGENVIEIENRAGSWMLYDAVTFAAPAGTKLATPAPRTFLVGAAAAPALANLPGARLQPVTLEVLHVGEAGEAELWIGGKRSGGAPSLRGGGPCTGWCPRWRRRRRSRSSCARARRSWRAGRSSSAPCATGRSS